MTNAKDDNERGYRTTAERIMSSQDFRRGVAEFRTGKPPNFETASWEYERGRQFGAVAPRNMVIVTRRRRLNQKALRFFKRWDTGICR
jgi:hypothetical protein